MFLSLASLNSGSNGNCYYIGNEQDAVFIDAGISCRETERRMKRLELSLERVRAIFISHEHSDHTRGVEVLSRKYCIPVYMTALTYRSSHYRPEASLLRTFSSSDSVRAGSLTIFPFPKSHDGADPHSFTVSANGITVGVFTDIGFACENLAGSLNRCHAAFLETNYDEYLLTNSNYPLHLKRRIRSPLGHLSNDQALELFLCHRPVFLKLLILSHLSAHNNNPQLVSNLFAPFANGTRIAVASRFNESELFRLE